MTSPSDKTYALWDRFDVLEDAIGPVPCGTGYSDITATGPTAIDHLTVPGGTCAASVKYAVDAWGTFTFGATPPVTALFCLYWGGTGGTVLVQLDIPAAGLWANASGQGWTLTGSVAWESATVATARLNLGWRTAAGVANSISWHVTSRVTGLTSGTDKDLTLAWGWVSGSATLTVRACHISRAA